MESWRVVAVEPEKEPYEKHMSFKEIQEFVDGNVEVIHLYDNILALVNETGALRNLEHNRHIILQEKGFASLSIVGNFVVLKKNEEDFSGLTDFELDEVKYIFRNTSKDATVFI